MQELSIAHNDISGHGAAMLADAVRHWKSLHTLLARDTAPADHTLVQLYEAVAARDSFQQCELPHLPPSMIKHVTAALPAFSLPPRKSTVFGTNAVARASVMQPARRSMAVAARARAQSMAVKQPDVIDEGVDAAIRAAAHATGGA